MERGKTLETFKADVLVIGSGGAGLYAAVSAAERGARTWLVDKGLIGRNGNTVMASGISVVGPWHLPGDGPEVLFRDTLEGGQGLNNQRMLRILIEETPLRVAALERWGLTFDRNPDGSYFLLQSGGHAYPRVLVRSDRVGLAIAKALRRRALQLGVGMQEDTFITNLLTRDGQVVGAVGIDGRAGKLVVFSAKAVVLATGGVAQLFPMSASQSSNTGDGLAAALRAGAPAIDLEMIQLFPTCLVYPPSVKGFALGLEGILLNRHGERFMARYDPQRLERSTRDITSRAIYAEIRSGRGTEHGGVYKDCRETPERVFLSYLDQYNFCLKRGLDLKKEPCEVAPALHYFMGGVQIDEWGRTGLPGLYAAGEVAGGLHGANRLGGNSLADLLVFGARAGQAAADWASESDALEPDPRQVQEETERVRSLLGRRGELGATQVRKAIQQVMWEGAGAIRHRAGLTKALERLAALQEELSQVRVASEGLVGNRELVASLEAENLLLVSRAVAISALAREESRGAHYREDFPARDDERWLKHVQVRLEQGQFQVSFVPVEGPS